MILQKRSPSCACKEIYDGTFTHKIKCGIGVTSALLKQKTNIELIDIDDLEKLMD